MITLTDYDGFAATYNDNNFITVTPYSQNSINGSKIEYVTNTKSIAVIYVTSVPATISGSSVYVQPLTIVFANGQTEVFYLNPLFYKSYTAQGSNNQLVYQYEQASQAERYITSTATATIDAQISAAMGGGSSTPVYQVTLTNNGTDTYDDTDIDFSVPSGLTSIVGKNLLLVFSDNTMENVGLTSPVLPAVIGSNIQFVAPPSGTITIIVS